MSAHSAPELAELRRLAEEVARGAAALVAERRRGSEVGVADRKTSEVDIVTEVDRESEAWLRRAVADRRPDDGFLGEEGGRAGSATGLTWVVDPIDGTVNFLYGVPHYAVSVAVVDEAEQSLAGAVVDVVGGAVYTAHRGGGATRDGVPLRVRSLVPLGERLVLTGFGYRPETRSLQGAAVARMLPQVRDIRRLGSAALDLCRLAEGAADAYVEEGLQLWDRAAAALVAEEAGARVDHVAGVGGSACTVAAPRDGFEELLALVRASGFLADGSR